MTAPVVTVNPPSRSKIGPEDGVGTTTVTFTVDQPVIRWEARLGGTGYQNGPLLGADGELPETWDQLAASGRTWDQLKATVTWETLAKAVVLAPGQTGSFDVDMAEVPAGDGTYRINVYAMNGLREVTPYGV